MSQEPDNAPDWIKKHNREMEDQNRQADEEGRRQLQASKVVEENGPAFSKQLVDRIGINVKALKELAGEELTGTISLANHGRELNCYFQVNRQSVRYGPELSRMSLFYKPGGNRIRRWYQDQDAGDLQLVSNGNEVRASVGGTPATAQQLADHIVEWMAERVKARTTITYI